jgi:hypothetical protein
MGSLHFDIRDLFLAIRLGWSGKKVWTGLCGLFVAYLFYSALVTAGYLMSGMSSGEVWAAYGLFPGAAPARVGGLAAILHLIAMIGAGVIFFITSSAMCKVTYQQLRGDEFYTSGEAFSFVKKHWGGIIFGPIACLALFVLFVVSGIVIGWIAGVIPVAGELAFAIGFIPIFFAALLAIFMVFVIAAALIMSPAIVGTVGEDALEVVIQSFSICWSQPWRTALYLAWLITSVWIGTALLSGLMTLALSLIGWASGMFMGAKLAGMLAVAQGYLPPIDISDPIRRVFPELRTVWTHLPEASASGSVIWAGRILAVMLIVITGVLLSYAQATFASGTSLIYVILRQKKDDENMLEWEDPAFEDFDFTDEANDDETSQPEETTQKEEQGASDETPEKRDGPTNGE